MDAARWWAESGRRGGGKDEAAEDLRFYGAADETIEEVLGDESEDDAFEVWPENWRALRVFLDCARSWEILVFPGGAWYHGIRPESMESVMRMNAIPRKEREFLLADLQAMEAAALPILNEKRDG